jgi:hypothetical protein
MNKAKLDIPLLGDWALHTCVEISKTGKSGFASYTRKVI